MAKSLNVKQIKMLRVINSLNVKSNQFKAETSNLAVGIILKGKDIF